MCVSQIVCICLQAFNVFFPSFFLKDYYQVKWNRVHVGVLTRLRVLSFRASPASCVITFEREIICEWERDS